MSRFQTTPIDIWHKSIPSSDRNPSFRRIEKEVQIIIGVVRLQQMLPALKAAVRHASRIASRNKKKIQRENHFAHLSRALHQAESLAELLPRVLQPLSNDCANES